MNLGASHERAFKRKRKSVPIVAAVAAPNVKPEWGRHSDKKSETPPCRGMAHEPRSCAEEQGTRAQHHAYSVQLGEKWEFIDIDKMNPMSLVRVEGSSKRLRQPARILSGKEYRVLLDDLQEPIRTMCIVAACLGLRPANSWARSAVISIGKPLKSTFNGES